MATLDAVVLVRDYDVESRDVGARRLHRVGTADRHPDRRTAPRRVGLLQMAHAFEQATQFGKRLPPR